MRQDISIGELAEWIYKNRSGEAFSGYSLTQILGEIYFGLDNGSLLVATNNEGKISGIAYGKIDNERKEYLIWNIIMTEPWVMKYFMELFLAKWPDYEVFSHRHGKKMVKLEPKKILHRLTKR
jgi:hypothetical protein